MSSSDSKNSVQARVPAYHKWVIHHLAETGGGTFALSDSAVLAHMIREWILIHEDYLRAQNLDETHFRKPAAVPNSDAPSRTKNSSGRTGAR